METYKVKYEVREQGAIGVWGIEFFLVKAQGEDQALEVARQNAYERGFEVRFPVSVAKAVQS